MVASQAEGRLTPERVQLLRLVCDLKGHFDSDQVTGQLQKRGLNISKATVYRNLPLLERAGIIRKTGLDKPGQRTRYEHVWGREHHDHLACSTCGAVVEFTDPAIEVLQDAVAKRHGFVLHSHHLDLVGLCSSCADRPGAQP
jgi:Fur family ferric uptake transcriptional regulator